MAIPPSCTTCPTTSAQARDLAAEHPEKVQELKDLFWQEAESYKVLPLMATLSTFFGMVPPLPPRRRMSSAGRPERDVRA